VLLPEKKFVQVPARKAYQPYGKSRSHKMYSWTNDNETEEADVYHTELEKYEFLSRSNETIEKIDMKNITDIKKSDIQIDYNYIISADKDVYLEVQKEVYILCIFIDVDICIIVYIYRYIYLYTYI
jgi:hypothetical protein